MKRVTYYEKLREQGYYIIAEIGVNYYEMAEKFNLTLLNAAKLMMKEAKSAGADAVKFQTYKAETLTLQDSPGSWDRNDIAVNTMYELFKMYDHFEEKEYIELAEYAKQIKVEFMSTPFDIQSVDYLNQLVNVYKISSSDITNIPLLKRVASKNKPIIMSVGASDLDEIFAAINIIRRENKHELTLLHCVLEYPTPYDHANLNKIVSLNKEFPNMIIGYSDHTKPDEEMQVLKTAYLMGAKVIEKHFTLDKNIKQKNDHFHSMNCKDLRRLKEGLEFIKSIQGEATLKCLDSELETRNSVRRSAISSYDLKKGDILSENMVILKRPGNGMSYEEIRQYFGKRIRYDLKKDVVLKKEDFE